MATQIPFKATYDSAHLLLVPVSVHLFMAKKMHLKMRMQRVTRSPWTSSNFWISTSKCKEWELLPFLGVTSEFTNSYVRSTVEGTLCLILCRVVKTFLLQYVPKACREKLRRLCVKRRSFLFSHHFCFLFSYRLTTIKSPCVSGRMLPLDSVL